MSPMQPARVGAEAVTPDGSERSLRLTKYRASINTLHNTPIRVIFTIFENTVRIF